MLDGRQEDEDEDEDEDSEDEEAEKCATMQSLRSRRSEGSTMATPVTKKKHGTKRQVPKRTL